MNIAALSPRAIAAATKVSVSSDLPVPAGPRIKLLEPRSMPAAEQRVELGRIAAHASRARSCVLCSAETSRGKTRTPPVSMTKS